MFLCNYYLNSGTTFQSIVMMLNLEQLLVEIMMFLLFCRTGHTQKMIVKLGEYPYGRYLKELAKRSLEDSEHLFSETRQRLLSVR